MHKLIAVKNFKRVCLNVILIALVGCESVAYNTIAYEPVNHRDDFVSDIRFKSDSGHTGYIGYLNAYSGNRSYGGGYFGVPEQLKVIWSEDRGWDEYHYKKVIDIPRPLPELIQPSYFIDDGYHGKKRNYGIALHFYDGDVQVQILADHMNKSEKEDYQRVETVDEKAELLWVRTTTITEREYSITLDNQTQSLLSNIHIKTDRGHGNYLKLLPADTTPLKQAHETSIMPYILYIEWIKNVDGHPVKMEKELHIPRPLQELEPGQWYGSIKSDNHYNITLTFTGDDVSSAVSVESKEQEPSMFGWQPVSTKR